MTGRKSAGEWPNWASKLFKGYPDEATAFAAWGAVLDRLEPPLAASARFGLARLDEYARRHGVLADETGAALNRLTGALFRETTGTTPLSITTAFLKQHLVGAEDARQAALDAPDGMAAAARARLAATLSAVAPVTIPRPNLARQLREQVEQYPVTLVYGGGGTGKSVLALRHLLHPSPNPVGLNVRADEAAEDRLEQTLKVLRSPAQYHHLPNDTIDRAIERLRAANPGEVPVLVVDIDALDEVAPPHLAGVRGLVRRWLSPPLSNCRAKLVVSCRPNSLTDRERRRVIADLTGEPAEAVVDQVGAVTVTGFDPDELAAAATALGANPKPRSAAGSCPGGPHPTSWQYSGLPRTRSTHAC